MKHLPMIIVLCTHNPFMETYSKSKSRTKTYDEKDYVIIPAGFEDELSPLPKYSAFQQLHPNASKVMRTSWIKKAAQYFRIYKGQGLPRHVIIMLLNASDYIYEQLENYAIEYEGGRIVNQSAPHRFINLYYQYELSLRYLNKFIEENAHSRDIIAAIKAKNQVMKDMITTGQELGVIHKKAKELRVLGDINLTSLPNEELEKLYQERIHSFNELMNTPAKQLEGPHAKIVNRALEESNRTNNDSSADDIIDADFEDK